MLLARAAASNDWPNFLPKATDDFNDSLKEGLRGSPKDAQSKSERASVQKFMLLQDNAEKIRRNDELDAKRQFELADRGGTFRPALPPANSFANRATTEKYGEVRKAADISGGVITDTLGEKRPIKLVQFVGPRRSYAVPARVRQQAARGRFRQRGGERL
jgi:hypothetical protein